MARSLDDINFVELVNLVESIAEPLIAPLQTLRAHFTAGLSLVITNNNFSFRHLKEFAARQTTLLLRRNLVALNLKLHSLIGGV